jgi:cytochrome c-type biogenesis protein CcmF
LLGTFLVRSGVLTSVHAFAVDPARGVFILAILSIFIGGSLAVFAWRAPLLRGGGIFAPISREGALILNNLLLASACATVFLGTLYPLALEAFTGEKISVGTPYYNLTFLPILLPLMLALPLGQALAWKRGDFFAVVQRLGALLGVSIALALGLIAFTAGGPVLAPLAIGLGAFLLLSGAGEIWTRSHVRGRPVSVAFRRAVGLPRSAWGSALAHAGLGITVIGIAAQAWSSETITAARPGTQMSVGRHTARLDSVRPRTGPNYTEDVVTLSLWRDGRPMGTLETTKRFYPARNSPTTEAGILTRGFDQIYVSVGEIGTDGSVGLRLYDKPLVLLIWIGSLFMAAGGGLSLTDRRLRVGVPVRARGGVAARAAPAGGAA